MFCRVQSFIEFSIKAETKLKPTAWKTKPKKTCLAFEYALLVSHLPYFLFCCGCGCFLGGTGERGVVFFGLKSCEKGMLLRKKTILHELCYWNSTNNKLQFYSSFKMTRDASVQIDLIKNLQHRQSVAKWRSGNHDLRIETSRHCVPKIPENVRICHLTILRTNYTSSLIAGVSTATQEKNSLPVISLLNTRSLLISIQHMS